jgi:hypothetical protein
MLPLFAAGAVGAQRKTIKTKAERDFITSELVLRLMSETLPEMLPPPGESQGMTVLFAFVRRS